MYDDNRPVRRSGDESITGRNRTWPQGMPPLRIERRRAPWQRRPVAAPNPPTFDETPPPYLRTARVVAGVLLVLLAWGSGVLLAALLRAIRAPLPHAHVGLHVAGVLLGLFGALLLAITLVGCLVAGAFCLSLAFGNREW